MFKNFIKLIFNIQKGFQIILRKISFALDIEIIELFDASLKPQYVWGMLAAAKQCKALGIKKFISIEFGVANGQGLFEMVKIAKKIKNKFDIDISIIGFDSGSGLPPPIDYRDLPYVWSGGDFRMEKKLAANTPYYKIYYGDVKDTICIFNDENAHTYIGFISFDLDYYSSTINAFKIFDGNLFLPRTPLYFDDVYGIDAMCNDFTGELLAINEFNSKKSNIKIAEIRGFIYSRLVKSAWNYGTYILHSFESNLYSKKV